MNATRRHFFAFAAVAPLVPVAAAAAPAPVVSTVKVLWTPATSLQLAREFETSEWRAAQIRALIAMLADAPPRILPDGMQLEHSLRSIDPVVRP